MVNEKTVYFSGIEEYYLLVGGDCKTGSPPVNKNLITESQHQRKAHLLQLFKLKIKQPYYTLLSQVHVRDDRLSNPYLSVKFFAS